MDESEDSVVNVLGTRDTQSDTHQQSQHTVSSLSVRVGQSYAHLRHGKIRKQLPFTHKDHLWVLTLDRQRDTECDNTASLDAANKNGNNWSVSGHGCGSMKSVGARIQHVHSINAT